MAIEMRGHKARGRTRAVPASKGEGGLIGPFQVWSHLKLKQFGSGLKGENIKLGTKVNI
jgi:hypothetical protein